MHKSLCLGLGLTAAVIATALTPTAGWAQTAADPTTTVTFTVTSGSLGITAPSSKNLTTGTGVPGTTISGSLGSVEVTDDRAALSAAWAATATSTDFTTGGATPDETIPAADASYTPGSITTTGVITATGSNVTLSGSAQTVVAGTAGVGNNTATWNPVVAVAIPAAAVGGGYTSTLTHSVS